MVSGLLLRSLDANVAADGRSFVVFVAGSRGVSQPGEKQSAVESVLGLIPGQAIPIDLNQPIIKAAIKRGLEQAIAFGHPSTGNRK